MRISILLPFLLFAIVSSCKAPTKVVESNYESKTIDVQLDNLTNQMVKSLSLEKKSKIAIMEFPDLHGSVSELGKFIPEELTTRLFMTKRFEVVERSLLNKVLEEQNLGISGLVDASSAAQIGKMLGVEAIVTGTITDMGNMLRINARIIATETASVFAVSSVSIEKEPHLVAMLERTASSPISSTNNKVQVSPDSPNTAKGVIEEDQILFEGMVETVKIKLVSVIHQGEKLIIETIGENIGSSDVRINLWHDSRFICNQGNEYSFRHQGLDYTSFRGRNLVPGVPTKMSATIKVPQGKLDKISLLELQFQYSNDRLLFRNIPIPYKL